MAGAVSNVQWRLVALVLLVVAGVAFVHFSTSSAQSDVVSAPARRNTPTDHQQQQPVVVVASVAAGDSHGLPASSPATLIDADHFRVVLTTTKGDVTLELRREWAPLGVDRFREMVSGGFFASSTTNKGIAIFRCANKFVLQFGIHGDPAVSAQWRARAIKDDPVVLRNEKFTLSFATSGANTRTTQLFFNIGDNGFLDRMNFSPIAKCVDGCDVFDRVEMKYAEKPNQGHISQMGNEYLAREFPDLDYITGARLVTAA